MDGNLFINNNLAKYDIIDEINSDLRSKIDGEWIDIHFNSISLDGSFTKDQLLLIIEAMNKAEVKLKELNHG